jgi:hypothetical protein
VTDLPTVCPTCCDPYERADSNARCPRCQPNRERSTAAERRRELDRPSREQRGYDWTWRKLSRRARRLQPFCTDCGTADDLTTDHTTEAWQRHARGQVIRLTDVDVVCRRCNTDRGAARGKHPTHEPAAALPQLDALGPWHPANRSVGE